MIFVTVQEFIYGKLLVADLLSDVISVVKLAFLISEGMTTIFTGKFPRSLNNVN